LFSESETREGFSIGNEHYEVDRWNS